VRWNSDKLGMATPGKDYLNSDYKNIGKTTNGNLWCTLQQKLGSLIFAECSEFDKFKEIVEFKVGKNNDFERNCERILEKFNSYNNCRAPMKSILFFEFVAYLSLFNVGLDQAIFYFMDQKPKILQDTSKQFFDTRGLKFVTNVVFDLASETGEWLSWQYYHKFNKEIDKHIKQKNHQRPKIMTKIVRYQHQHERKLK